MGFGVIEIPATVLVGAAKPLIRISVKVLSLLVLALADLLQ